MRSQFTLAPKVENLKSESQNLKLTQGQGNSCLPRDGFSNKKKVCNKRIFLKSSNYRKRKKKCRRIKMQKKRKKLKQKKVKPKEIESDPTNDFKQMCEKPKEIEPDPMNDSKQMCEKTKEQKSQLSMRQVVVFTMIAMGFWWIHW